MGILLLFLFIFLALSVRSYEIHDLESDCLNGEVSYQLSEWGPGSAGILKASQRISYSKQLHCRVHLLAPPGQFLMVSIRAIGFRVHLDGSCQDYLQIQGKPYCRNMVRYDEELHFSSESNSAPNEMDVIYHAWDGLDNKTFSGYSGFIFTYTAFLKASGEKNSSFFLCSNDHYIWSGLTCDGHNNCGDLSDEDNYGDSQCDGGGNGSSTVLIILGLLIVFVLIVMCVATLLCSKNETVRRFSTTLRSRTISFIPRLGTRTST